MSDFLTFAEAAAAKEFPRRPSTLTLWRWATKGVRGGIKLRTVAVGGKRYVPASAIGEFLEACSAHAAKLTQRADANPQSTSTPRTRTTRERNAAIHRAEKILNQR